MTTYNSYEEAKIANPEESVYKVLSNGLFISFDKEAEMIRDVIQGSDAKLCNPADHCMTVEQFLNAGHKLVGGDAFTGVCGKALIVGADIQELGINNRVESDSICFILRAAALEEKPFLQTGEEFEHTKTLNFIYDRMVDVHGENENVDYMHKLKNAIMMVKNRESPCNTAASGEEPKRVKVEFVKVEFASDKEKAEAFIGGGLRYFTHGKVKGDMERDTIPVTRLDELLCGNAIYRRIETEMTERDEFVEVIKRLQEDYILNDNYDTEQFGEFLFDSGELKLVE